MARTIHDARFTDVPADNQFYREITWIASHQIDRGYSDGTFRPLNNMDRATMAAYVYHIAARRSSLPEARPASRTFLNHPCYKGVEWMKAQGHHDRLVRTAHSAPDSSVNRDSGRVLLPYAGSPAYEAPPGPVSRTFRRITCLPRDQLAGLAGRDHRLARWFVPPGGAGARDAMAAFVFHYSTRCAGVQRTSSEGPADRLTGSPRRQGAAPAGAGESRLVPVSG